MRRLSYDESCRVLQKQGLLEEGEFPSIPRNPPRHNDEELGVEFFRMMVADAKLENLTLPRTFFSRSEIRASSFKNTDLSESTVNWNDFIEIDFTDADLSNSDFRACVFKQVRFCNANLAGVDLRYCGFSACNFSGANLSGARLTVKTGKSLRLTEEQQSVIDWQGDDGEEPEGG